MNFTRGEVIDFVINNVGNATGPHPWHAHGHTAWLLGYKSDAGAFDEAKHAKLLNEKNPPMCDVFPVPHNGWAVVRLQLNNPGEQQG